MSTRDKKIIIVLVGAVLLALSYFLVFQQAQEKKTQLESENATLKQKYDELSILATKVEDYKKKIVTMNDEIEKTLVHYPSYLQIEDTIMDVVSLEEETKSRVSNLSVATPTAIDINTGAAVDENAAATTTTDDSTTTDGTTTDGTTTDSTTTDGTTTDGTTTTDQTAATQNTIQPLYQLYGVESTVVFEANNKGLKKLIELVAGADNRQKVASLTVAFNESKGKLDGTLVYDAYFLYGIDKAYESPYIPSMPHGTKNVFGTVGD